MPNNSRSNSANEVETSKQTLPVKITPSEDQHSEVHLRRLTVSSLYIPYQGTFYNKKNTGRKYPFLRLSGRWMEEAGFPPNSQVDVIVENNLLIIKPAGI